MCIFFFFFNDTATTEIYTLSLHDALPILRSFSRLSCFTKKEHASMMVLIEPAPIRGKAIDLLPLIGADRKSTRLNSSHRCISYAVFCLKKKKQQIKSYLHALANKRTKHSVHSPVNPARPTRLI